MTARDLGMLPVAAVAAPWRAADPRRRVCHVHAARAAPARSVRGWIERRGPALGGRASLIGETTAAVNKCGSGSPTSSGKCGGSRPPHRGHWDCQPGASAEVHALEQRRLRSRPEELQTGAGAELQAAPPTTTPSTSGSPLGRRADGPSPARPCDDA